MKKFFKKIEDKWKKAVKWYKSDKNQFYQLYPSNSHEQTNQLFDQKTKQETVEHLTKDKTIENGHFSQIKYPDNIVQPQNKHDQTKQLFKQVEQTFTTNPLAAQWYVQNKKAISEGLDNHYADYSQEKEHKEHNKLKDIESKFTKDQILELETLYNSVHANSGETSLLGDKIEQKINDESKFEQNNTKSVKEAAQIFMSDPVNAKWYVQRIKVEIEDDNNFEALFEGRKEKYIEKNKLNQIEHEQRLNNNQILKLEKAYQTSFDPTQIYRNSKYSIRSKFTKKNQRKIEDLSKQYSLNSERLPNKFDYSPQEKGLSKAEMHRQAFLINRGRMKPTQNAKTMELSQKSKKKQAARHRETNKKLLAKEHAIQSRNLER